MTAPVVSTPLGPIPARIAPVLSVPEFDRSIPTLGWGVIDWCEDWLLQPDGDLAGEPFRFTHEQMNFILWWYALTPVGDKARFIYRRGVLRRSKGWGKSPFLGALALAELLGPVRFGGWDADGEPYGVPEAAATVVVAGVSQAQTENTMSAIRAMAEDSGLVEEYGLDVGLTRILAPGERKIVPMTANAATAEGGRPTFAIMDETHWWTRTNGGHALARVIRRNLGKRPGGMARVVETTNAHEPGRDSIAEASYMAWRAIVEGRAKIADILYDSREAPFVNLSDEAAVLNALRAAYGDATWVDLDRVLAEVYDPDTPASEARRFYLNQIVEAEDSWLAPDEWHANGPSARAQAGAEPLAPLADGTTVTLGFDGSLTDDSTALVACRVDDGAVFLLGVWEKPEGPKGDGWEVPKDAVRGLVEWAFGHLDVVAFFSDVAYWETDVDAWRDEYAERLLVKATTRHSVGFDMRGHQLETTRGVEALHRAATDGDLPWGDHLLVEDTRSGSEILTRHVLNARRRPNRWGVGFGKENRESPKKVDAVAAMLLARMARSRVLGDGVLRKRRKKVGRLYGF